jgi:hypothetical protein
VRTAVNDRPSSTRECLRVIRPSGGLCRRLAEQPAGPRPRRRQLTKLLRRPWRFLRRERCGGDSRRHSALPGKRGAKRSGMGDAANTRPRAQCNSYFWRCVEPHSTGCLLHLKFRSHFGRKPSDKSASGRLQP